MTSRELRGKREGLGLTQRKLGELLDISPQQISNYENGRMPIPKTVELALETMENRAASQKKGVPLSLSKREGDFIRRFVNQLRESLGDKIILTLLFGSKARREGDEESDLDVFILLRTKTYRDREKIFAALFSLDPYNPYHVSPVIYSLKDFQINERLQSPFITNLKKEGILL